GGVSVLVARGVSEVPERGAPLRHEEAQLESAWVPLDRAVQLFLAGELHNGGTAMGILAAYASRQGGFATLREAGAGERGRMRASVRNRTAAQWRPAAGSARRG